MTELNFCDKKNRSITELLSLIHNRLHRKGSIMTFATGLCIFIVAALRWLLHLLGTTMLVAMIFCTPVFVHASQKTLGGALILSYAISIVFVQIHHPSKWVTGRKKLIITSFFGSILGSFILLSISRWSFQPWDQTLIYSALALFSLILYVAKNIFHRKMIDTSDRNMSKSQTQRLNVH